MKPSTPTGSSGLVRRLTEAHTARTADAERARKKELPDGSGWFDPKREYRFDHEQADLATEFFPRFLRHSKGEMGGQPFHLMRWQASDIIRPLFGWYVRTERGWVRKYRVSWDEVPRKNGKSTLAAGVGLKLTFADFEPGAEVYSTAADRDQARLVFNEARRMRDADPELRRRSIAYTNSMIVPSLASSYKVLSADAGTKHGLNAHGIINDEVHAHRTRDLYDVLHTSMGARRQPLEFNITTAGYDRHSIAWELHEYALRVRDGIVHDDTFHPVIYAADLDDDWTRPETWAKANPNLGVSISLDYLAKECQRAQDVPGYENTFKQLHLNMWTEQASRWLPMADWDACAGPVPWERMLEAHRGRECFLGLDLSTVNDITAAVAVIAIDNRIVWIPRFWIPEERVRRKIESDRVPYDVWIRDGAMHTTPGNVVDQDFIRRDINQLAEQLRIREIPMDRWNAAQIMTQLQGDGFTVVPFGQGFASMSAPSKELEGLVVGRRLEHGGHPVLRWMASNVAVKRDPAGNIKPDKSSSAARIDGIVAGIMGVGRAIVAPKVGGIDGWLRDPVIV